MKSFNQCLYKVGDKFIRKHSCDTDVMEVVIIEYKFGGLEPEYTLQSIKFDKTLTIGQEALTELFYKL